LYIELLYAIVYTWFPSFFFSISVIPTSHYIFATITLHLYTV